MKVFISESFSHETNTIFNPGILIVFSDFIGEAGLFC